MSKIHYRKCAGCGEVKDREELIKITSEHLSDEIYINPSGKIFGRSVYICNDKNCISTAFKKDKISKYLKKKVPVELQKKIFTVLEDDIMIKH